MGKYRSALYTLAGYASAPEFFESFVEAYEAFKKAKRALAYGYVYLEREGTVLPRYLFRLTN